MGNDKPFKEPEALPFRRKVTTRQPGIVGAQWWNDGLQEMATPVSRRGALKALMVAGGAVAAGGVIIALASDGPSSGPSSTIELLDTLETQRSEGWNFGAPDEALSFTGQVPVQYEAASLERLATELSPLQDKLKPFYQPTLFQALSGAGAGSSPEAAALRASLKPVFTQSMDTAYRQGQALNSLFPDGAEVKRTTAIIVDLPGPEAVAFAAGLARRFEPVFTFDNWPHPRGVVPAHLTLGAVLYYRPLLDRMARERTVPASPVFVLDRNRLLPYTKPQAQFDNRYLARLPPALLLNGLGIKHVLYVAPGGTELQELDDINEDFVSYRESWLDVKLVAATDFKPAPSEPSEVEDVVSKPYTSDALPELRRRNFYYGGSLDTHGLFWSAYPWMAGAAAGAAAGGLAAAIVSNTSGGHRYEPRRRATMFVPLPSSASGAPRRRPDGFAKVQVQLAAGTRKILGFPHGSYSSWNRALSSHSSSGYSFSSSS
ncbi:MAG TPA: hypothetical protein VF815_37630 [Myxococcaceae bacterium]|jgi:hypothetical protein